MKKEKSTQLFVSLETKNYYSPYYDRVMRNQALFLVLIMNFLRSI